MHAIENAIAKAAKAAKDAATLQEFAPHLVGEPRLFYPSDSHGARVAVCYKLRTGADLAALIDALPPVDCIAYRGTFAGVVPADHFRERDGARLAVPCDGVAFSVELNATTGAYPCDEHALGAHWYTDTPAGRACIRVDFHHNTRENWPHVGVRYERGMSQGRRNYGKEYNTKKIESCTLVARPGGCDFFAYARLDAYTPGSFLCYFTNPDDRAAFVDTLEA